MKHRRSRVERLLREFVREALAEGPAGAGVTADPTTGTSGGARDYELERGVDIFGFNFNSPGDQGGNPMRPDDAEEYIGFKTKGIRPDEAASDLAPKPVAGESK